MKTIRPASILQALFTFIAVLLLGLSFNGCASLDKTGVYAGDQFLYQSELTTTTSYDLIHAYVSWEKDNRALLTRWPEIRKSADKMRADSKQWFASTYALHDAYKANPTDANKTAYQRSVDILHAALNESLKYMALAAQPTP